MNHDVAPLLSALGQGDPHAAGRLLPLAYEELRKPDAQRLAQEQPGQQRRQVGRSMCIPADRLWRMQTAS
jgi:hypothetical protein